MTTETQYKPRWTIETVRARLEEAARIAHQLPSARGRGYFNAWSAIVQSAEKSPAFLDPEAVTRMAETSRWLQWLDEPADRHLIWLFVGGVMRKKIAEEYGISRSTMERRVKSLMKKITDRLNGAAS